MRSRVQAVCVFAIALFVLVNAASSIASATNNPVPTVVAPVVPQAVVPGSGGFTLKVYGANFVSGAVVNWNRQPRSTTFISVRELQAQILASDVAAPTAGYITVTNPPPGGGVSSSSYGLVEVHTPTATINVGHPHHYFRGGTYFLPLADFNNDGILDFVAQASKTELEARLGNGDGSFRFGSMVTHNSFSGSAIATGDFNNDGNEDVVFGANWQGNPVRLGVNLGNGDGTFRKGAQFGSFLYLSQIVVGDFNRDGNLDLVTNPSKLDGEIGVFVGNGDGTFRHLKDYIINAEMVTADLNGDGILDLALFNQVGLYIMLGNGDGTFSKPRKLTTQHFSSGGCGFGPSIYVTDFNGDGKADLALCDSEQTNGKIWVFLGNGDGTFEKSATLPVASSRFGFTFMTADFNADGKTDLLVNYNVTDHQTETDLYLGNGDGTFGSKKVITLTGGTDYNAELGIVPTDFNSGGLLDFIYLQPGDDVVFIQK